MHRDLTPMMRQYQQLRARYPGMLLMFRLGDFYELFFDDAVVAARDLEITLTSREVGKGRRVPMCGIPHHALDSYLARLVERGHRIAICEQLEDPRRARGLVRRDVVRVVTPGTLVEPALLPGHANNFLAALRPGGAAWGLAAADLSTGEFCVTELAGAEAAARMAEELARLAPREVLVPDDAADVEGLLPDGSHLTRLEAWAFDPATARQRLLAHFQVATLDGYGCEHLPLAVAAAGALLHYLQQTQRAPLRHLWRLVTYSADGGPVVDEATRRNLELVRNLRDGGSRGTLLEVVDQTLTPMGARRLRQWLLQPLRDRPAILRRQEAVAYLVGQTRVREDVRASLRGLADLHRLVGRAGHGSATPRDLVALAASLRRLPSLAGCLGGDLPELLADRRDAVGDHTAVAALIEAAIADHPPATVQDGGVIRDGYSPELDELRRLSREGKAWIATLEATERQRTGIKSLRVGYNKVFGYYLEVTRPNLHLVPPDYIRKQTLVGAERFVTQEMKEKEAAILGAEERIAELEAALFAQVRDQVAAQAGPLLRTADAVADLDALAALAEVAVAGGYTRPEITDEPILEIRAGRHPVVERTRAEERFVPNDLVMTPHDRAILIVTGPNMAGKSTYLRQAALIVLLAQIGSYVPAAAARIGVVDRIFTRVGATDDLATGRSTFLVEMQEVAHILHHATARSLIILDEVGRGTSTYDGMSLAWAVVEYLHDRVGARTLFATHYHELTELADLLPRVRNVTMLVREEGQRIVFLRQVADGRADRSYGIHVAQLAGLPPAVIEQARRILARLEATARAAPAGEAFLPPVPSRATGAWQLSLPLAAPSAVEEALLALPLESMTPMDAMAALHDLRERLRRQYAAPRPAEGGKVVRMRRKAPGPDPGR